MTIAAGAAAGGPGWTDILTAVGTVGAVIVAVGIALWTERRSDKRLKEERARSDRALAEQQKQAGAAIEDERAYGRAELDEERRIAREREQLTQAYAVQVVLSQHPGKGSGSNQYGDRQPSHTWRLTAIVVNHGLYTISRVEIQFCIGNSLTPQHRYERVPGFDDLPKELRRGDRAGSELPLRGVLTPFDKGIRFETDEIHEDHLVSPYPIVRWVDHWGTWWEHKRGAVRRIADGEQWGL
jgi:hypothetical protein